MAKVLCFFILFLAVRSGCIASQSTFPTLTIPDCLGVNTHFSGYQQAQVDQIEAAGFRVVRENVYWSNVEKRKGIYDFSAYDAYVNSFASKGIRPLFILEYKNPIYGEDHPYNTEKGKAAFIAYARACAEHFKGKGIIWDILNEPNRYICNVASPNPYKYVDLLKDVYPVIKKAAPDSLVVAPSINRWDYGFIESAFKAGLLDCVDAVSVHPYEPSQPEDAIVFYSKVHSLMRRYGPKDRQIPVISGEWGFNTSKWGVSLEKQAQHISRMFLTNIMCGCPISIWYDWHNDGIKYENSEHNYGVVFNDFKEKPAYVAMKTLSTELNGYTYCARIISETGDDYTLLFQKGDDYRLAAWTTGKPHNINVPIDVASATIVSLMGKRCPASIKQGMLTLNLCHSVQYIEPSVPSRRLAAEAAWEITKRAGYKWDGSSKPFVKAMQSSKGINLPLTRVVKLDTSAYPSLDLLPPVNGKLLVEVKRPSTQLKKAFSGKLVITDMKGINLAGTSFPVKLAIDEDRTAVAIKIAGQPESIFRLACSLIDQSGQLVTRLPAKQYSIVETFAGGEEGDKVESCSANFCATAFTPWSDKPKNASGEASLTYIQTSEIGSCAKLDYSLNGAKCSADIVPTSPLMLSVLPQSLKVWIKGDGSDCSLRSEIKDAGEEIYQPDYGIIDFTDWRCIEMDMTYTSGDHIGGNRDGRMTIPLNWTKLLIIDNMARNIKSSIYVSSMLLCYD